MKRFTVLVIGMLAASLFAVACAGGDKPSPTPTKARPTRTATARATATVPPTATRPPQATPTPASPDGGATTGGSGADGLLSTLLGSALGGATGSGPGAGALGSGDPELKRYVLSVDELPAGYIPLGEFTFSAADGLSTGGVIDVAMSMAASANPAASDPSDVSAVMSMVMRFEDLQDIGTALDEVEGLTEQDLRDAFDAVGGAGLPFGVEVLDVSLLDASGLGEGGFGMSVTLDLSGLSGIGGGADVPSVMTMRMYIFGRGRYAGALMRVGFSEVLPADVDERALARIIDQKLASAP